MLICRGGGGALGNFGLRGSHLFRRRRSFWILIRGNSICQNMTLKSIIVNLKFLLLLLLS